MTLRVNRRFARHLAEVVLPSPGAYSEDYTINQTGWLTVPIAAEMGQIPNGYGASIDELATQLDVKNKWSDNSLKLGAITAKLTSTGVKTIALAAAYTGTFTPTAPVLSVQFVITAGAGSGSTYTAALGAYSASDKWLDGPNCIEWRKSVRPTKAGPVEHDNLLVIFDVRSYVDGDHRVNVQVLNCRDNANMDSTTYSCTFIDTGVTIYTAPAAMKHCTFCPWLKYGVYIGVGREALVTLDFSKFYSTYQLPKPLLGLPNTDYTADLADVTKFAPLRFGLINPALNTPGAGAYLGPISLWDMRFLVNQSVSQRAVSLHHAYSGIGAFTQSYITRNDDTVYRLDDVTEGSIFMLGVTDRGPYPATLRCPVVVNTLEGNNAYRGARNLDDAYYRLDDEHIPQVGLVAYMTTGDRCYLDMAKAFAVSSVFRTQCTPVNFPDAATDGSLIRCDRNAVTGAHGVSFSQTSTNPDPRANARTLRNVVYAAQMMPDADAERSYWLGLVNDNMAWLDYYNTKRAAPGTAWGDGVMLFEGYVGNTISGTTTGAFMQAFGMAELIWNVYWANLQGVFTVPAGAITFAKRVAGLYAAMVTHTSDLTEPARLGPYYPQVCKRLGPVGTGLIELPATYAAFAALDDPAVWPYATLGYVIGGNGVHTRMVIDMGVYWDVTDAAAAKVIVDAYMSGGVTIEADAIASQNQYAIQIPQT